MYQNAKKTANTDIFQLAKQMESYGAGELLIQSVDRDGTFKGLDQELLFAITRQLSIPITGIGGLSSTDEIKRAHHKLNLNGYGAGSLFVYQGVGLNPHPGKHRGVLINYPTSIELKCLF